MELVWDRVRVKEECFWVNLREDNKVFESKMPSVWIEDGRIQNGWHHHVESEWMSEVLFVQNGWIQDCRIQDGCHHQFKWEWMSLSQIELVWVRVRMEWEYFWVKLREDTQGISIQDGSVWIQDGRVQDDCHHQFKSERISEVSLSEDSGN